MINLIKNNPRLIPEVEKTKGVKQDNPHHCFDVYDHTMKAIETVSVKDKAVWWAVLFHDTGKPETKRRHKDGSRDVFYGHAEASARIAANVTSRLNMPEQLRKQVVELVKYHDYKLATTEASVKKLLKKLKNTSFSQWASVRRADILAQSPLYMEDKLTALAEIQKIAKELTNEGEKEL